MKATDLNFAVIAEGDIDSILEIEEQSFGKPWSRTSFLEELSCRDSYNYRVRLSPDCEDRKQDDGYGRIIAYICFRMITDEVHILKIAVAPEWRCCGVGFRVLEKCLSMGAEKGAVSSFLEVGSCNGKAIALYNKFGFNVIGKRRGYYQGTGEDALVLMKKFDKIPLNPPLQKEGFEQRTYDCRVI